MGNQQFTQATHRQETRSGSSIGVEIKKEGGLNKLTIKPGENLDSGSASLFSRAIAEAQHDVGTLIVVDMEKTRNIFDSGVALLKVLDERSWRRASKIRIINCSPHLKRRLTQGLTPGKFNLSDTCIMLETSQ